MTTTEQFGGQTPPPPPPSTPSGGRPQRVIRRSRNDRVAAGVSGGLGAYFGVDPVLFRVLFATSAFFGGAGVLAYLVAWAAIPEEGAVNAPIDRFIAGLRRRRIPVWLVAAAAGLFLWAVAFSWWAPGHFLPVWIVVIALIAIFARRSRRAGGGPGDPVAPYSPEPYSPTVSLDKDESEAASGDAGTAGIAQSPTWMADTRSWIAESKAARRARRRRAFPIRIAAVVALVVTISILAAVDATNGIALPVYAWVTFGIVALALLVGLVLRRTPWSLVTLLVPSIIGIIAFGTTDASLHDGTGQRDWTPTSSAELKSDYRLAFGQGVLDLRRIGTLTQPRTVDITLGSGQVRLIVPRTMNTRVVASVHLGAITIDGQSDVDGWDSGGFGVNRTILPETGATGQQLTVNVHLADGNVDVDYRG
jgi:phage shock protein PspC (stress-responsive transcriptional regulator)